MATAQAAQAAQTPKAAKTTKEPVKLCDRIKAQLNAQALRGRLSVDEIADLEQHIKKIAALVA